MSEKTRFWLLLGLLVLSVVLVLLLNSALSQELLIRAR